MAARIRLEADPRSVARARRFCAATLEEWGVDGEVASTCVLLVSELASNAVLHARTEFTVRIARGGRLRVEVDDGDPRLPHGRDYAADASSGRGLKMVRTLARASGSTPAGAGKTVWFELDWDAAMAR